MGNRKEKILNTDTFVSMRNQNTRVLKAYMKTAMEILDYVTLRNYDKECMGHKICILLALKRCSDFGLSESTTKEIQERIEELSKEIGKKCGALMALTAMAYEVHTPEEFLEKIDDSFKSSLAVKVVLAFISNRNVHKYFDLNVFVGMDEKQQAFNLLQEMQDILE